MATSATRREARPFTGRIATAQSAVELRAPHSVAWFSVPRSEFRFVQGAPTQFRSTPNCMRSFCPRCGTQLTFENDEASDEIDITTCSLDDPEQLPSKDHTRTSSKLKWVKLADGLPEHREARPAG